MKNMLVAMIALLTMVAFGGPVMAQAPAKPADKPAAQAPTKTDEKSVAEKAKADQPKIGEAKPTAEKAKVEKPNVGAKPAEVKPAEKAPEKK